MNKINLKLIIMMSSKKIITVPTLSFCLSEEVHIEDLLLLISITFVEMEMALGGYF